MLERSKMRLAVVFAVVAVLLVAGCGQPVDRAQTPPSQDAQAKYVFLFIGDGMGPAQSHIAEIYMAAVDRSIFSDPKPGVKPLAMTGFPILGNATTYSASHQTTDSAAGGTALATGRKTSNGTISMDPDRQYNYTSIATVAKSRGMKVGIVSTTSIADATPAVFYAHQDTRSNHYEIGMQLAASPFDYFAGSKLAPADGPQGNVFEVAAQNGFTVVENRSSLNACRPGQRVFFQSRMPYEIDRPSSRPSLAELTAKGIQLLDNPDGFFMMVEAAKVDHAGHGNDARVAIEEMRAFDRAVQEAIRFYRKHPQETLIVITADHETGGLTLGCAGAKSPQGIASLAAQKQSWNAFNYEVYAPFKRWQPWTSAADDIPEKLKAELRDAFGLDYDELSADQRTKLEDAYDLSMSQKPIEDRSKMTPDPTYGRNDPLPLAVSQIVSQRAGIGWSTLSHTPMPVLVRALGAGAPLFSGSYDNTDVPRKIGQAMHVEFPVN